MRWISFIIALLIFTIVGSSNMMNYLTIGQLNIRPQLLIILLLFLTANIEPRDAILVSFITGFLADISGVTIGPALIAFGIMGSGFSTFKEMLVLNRMRYQAVTLFLFSILALATIEALTFIKTGQSSPKFFYAIVLQSLYTALVGPIIWKGLANISFIFGIVKTRRRR